MRLSRYFSSSRKVLQLSTINQDVVNAKYAVRGLIVDRMDVMKKEIAEGTSNYPFSEFCETNIGNPQYFGQKPISFLREVLSAVMNPELIQRGIYHQDVNNRAQLYLDTIRSVGSYSESTGTKIAREGVARYIAKRDGVDCSPDDIILGNGASESISQVMQLINIGPDTGFMVPIPQYPLYSAEITLNGNHFVGYYLDEDNGWQMSPEEMVRSYEEAISNGIDVRAVILINPGNPTGNIFTEDSLKFICQFAYDRGLVILSDEVYQTNIYAEGKKFISMRKILSQMPEEVRNTVEIFSFNSTSKGVVGECGMRGGYMELCNIDPEVHAQMNKYKGISLCSNSVGQLAVDLMVNPPTAGVESQETVQEYKEEVRSLFESLKRRAVMVEDMLGKMRGVTTQPVEGALYAFPRVDLPQKFVQEAESQGVPADIHYCMRMLEEVGIVNVPGTGFKQREGTWHFRTTILPLPESKFNQAFEDLRVASDRLMDQYSK